MAKTGTLACAIEDEDDDDADSDNYNRKDHQRKEDAEEESEERCGEESLFHTRKRKQHWSSHEK